MSPRFAYIYFMRDDPDRVRAAVPKHVSHWHGLVLSGYVGSPFEDHTGGLITFDAEEDRARDAVERILSCSRGCSPTIGSSGGLQSDSQQRQLRVYTEADSTNC